MAQQRVVVRHRRLPAPRAREWVGQQRPAGRRAERRRGLPQLGVALIAPGHDHAPAGGGHGHGERVRVLRRLRPRGRAGHKRPAVGASAAVRRQGRILHQRLAQRKVEVYHPGLALKCAPVRAAGERAHPAQPPRRCLMRAHLEKPLGRLPEDLHLVDRLAGAVLAQLGRAVGREDQQRHARLVRLDRRRQQLRGGSARGARHRHRRTCRLRQPQREEAAATLVDVRVAAQPRLAGEAQHQRRAARPRRGARVAQPAACQLVHERAQQEVGVGGGWGLGTGHWVDSGSDMGWWVEMWDGESERD